MSNVIQLTPNEWVCESVLIAVTGLKPGTILRARKECWQLGVECSHTAYRQARQGSRFYCSSFSPVAPQRAIANIQ
ncbi:excisionase family protein, partial [Salmonella enterica]|uniref:excisionase family protein n=1 Tax=Salmonella enterica TaxID=28901 RepID=UPI001482B589